MKKFVFNSFLTFHHHPVPVTVWYPKHNISATKPMKYCWTDFWLTFDFLLTSFWLPFDWLLAYFYLLTFDWLNARRQNWWSLLLKDSQAVFVKLEGNNFFLDIKYRIGFSCLDHNSASFCHIQSPISYISCCQFHSIFMIKFSSRSYCLMIWVTLADKEASNCALGSIKPLLVTSELSSEQRE